MLFAKLFSGRREQAVRKKNSTRIRLAIPFKEYYENFKIKIKIFIKILTLSIYPKSAYNKYPKK